MGLINLMILIRYGFQQINHDGNKRVIQHAKQGTKELSCKLQKLEVTMVQLQVMTGVWIKLLVLEWFIDRLE